MANPSPKAERPAEKDATLPASPVAVYRFGHVSAAVFTQQVKLRNGKTATVLNVSLRRSYRTADGEWENTHSLRTADLLPAAYALIKCADFAADATGTDDEERE